MGLVRWRRHRSTSSSGGVGTLADLRSLVAIEADGRRLAGAITGKAIYEGRFTVEQGVAALAGTAEETA